MTVAPCAFQAGCGRSADVNVRARSSASSHGAEAQSANEDNLSVRALQVSTKDAEAHVERTAPLA
jgi:hypothetical protein